MATKYNLQAHGKQAEAHPATGVVHRSVCVLDAVDISGNEAIEIASSQISQETFQGAWTLPQS